jgi:lipopolysaccharide assembly protein A
MNLLAWAVRFALFVILLAFAAKNTDPVTLKFYFELAWQAPLVAVLLAFFLGGVVLGLMAMMGTFFSQRREIARLRKIEQMRSEASAAAARQPPAAEG